MAFSTTDIRSSFSQHSRRVESLHRQRTRETDPGHTLMSALPVVRADSALKAAMLLSEEDRVRRFLGLIPRATSPSPR